MRKMPVRMKNPWPCTLPDGGRSGIGVAVGVPGGTTSVDIAGGVVGGGVPVGRVWLSELCSGVAQATGMEAKRVNKIIMMPQIPKRTIFIDIPPPPNRSTIYTLAKVAKKTG